MGAITLRGMLNRRFLALLCCCAPSLAWAIDLQPNDIVAPPPDKTAIQIAFINTERSDFYINGNKAASTARIPGNASVNSDLALLRLSRSYTLGQLPAVSFIQTTAGNIRPTGSIGSLGSAEGTGDLSLATAIWPYANHTSRTYLGVAGYVFLPTGSYSNQRLFNLGENRYRTDLQVGFQKPIYKNLDGMIAFDTMWFGANSQFLGNNQLTQKPLYKTQLGPSYRINPIFTVAASYLYVAGGETSINGVSQNNMTQTQRYLLSAVAQTAVGKFTLQYGNDLQVTNGFAESRRLILRYAKAF